VSRKRIALIGSRGVPARYGGFETLMAELGPRLVERGYEVTIYCRSHLAEKGMEEYQGTSLVTLPTIPTKYFDTPVHTLLSCLHAMGRYDAALVVNGANAIFVPILRIWGIRVALNVDGIEKKRAKWGFLGRWVYALSERLSVVVPNVLVTDAKVIHDYYLDTYSVDSTTIAYGVAPGPVAPGATLERLGLAPGRYLLYVSRFEPENNPHRVVEAYRDVAGDLPLVMVGWAPYADRFIASFKNSADDRVLFPGPVYGEDYLELLSNALCYIQATEVGGTHPALVEAMGFGNCILSNDTPENREVVGDAGLYFSASEPGTLTEAMTTVIGDEARARMLGEAARTRALERYSWDGVAEAYDEMLGAMLED
jgi:glycosyltransferase involved in cell wall biosynthesis